MATFGSFSGTVTMINDFRTGIRASSGCNKLITVQGMNGDTVNFVITPTTYFIDQVMIAVGDLVTGFYDFNAPVPLIYPPQHRAIVMAKVSHNQNIKVDFFNTDLISSDGMLQLTIGPHTQIITENGQAFTANISNRNLIVLFGASTRSIPAQTVPDKIIVMCR